jgi:hypothetical protein
MSVALAPGWEQLILGLQAFRLSPILHGVTLLRPELELYRRSRSALNNLGSAANLITNPEIDDARPRQITAALRTVNCQVERG